MPVKIQADRQKESVKAEGFSTYLDGVLLANSKNLGWRGLQAQAYRYQSPSYEPVKLPWVENSYLIEIQTSGQTVVLEQKIKQWTKRHWHRGDTNSQK